jgi:hypothetical protein
MIYYTKLSLLESSYLRVFHLHIIVYIVQADDILYKAISFRKFLYKAISKALVINAAYNFVS